MSLGGTATTSASYGLSDDLPDEAKGAPMFILPAYDPTAIAMLGFGILAALSLPFIF